jgi:hypothetical protein
MRHPGDEQELLDEEEALARLGLQHAVRAIGIDLIDGLALPPELAERAAFDSAVAAVSSGIGHRLGLELIGAWLLKIVPGQRAMSGILSAAKSAPWLR